jgi:predicted RecA/RadA family phage recombinase
VSASAEDRIVLYQEGKVIGAKMAASTTVYKNCGVMYDATGHLVNAADTASCTPAGVATEKTTSGSTAGDTQVAIYRRGVFTFAASSATQAWVGIAVYWVDNQTVALAATTDNDVKAGTCVGVNSATEVLVDINV